MGFQNNINKSNQDLNNVMMNHQLVLSTDAKPRLKWTPELHQRFIDAVNQLGGAYKATPKGLMRVMDIPGLTLYHLKSHLQKYRLGKNQNHYHEQEVDDNDESCREAKLEDGKDDDSSSGGSGGGDEHKSVDGSITNGNLEIAKALQLQMEVQRRLHEQIEVQRHLQLRIEAQGKYLQKVLKRAQETLTSYASNAVAAEDARAELSQLVSMVSRSSSLTESRGLSLEELDRYVGGGNRSSMESSLTSWGTARGEEEEEEEEGKEGEGEEKDVDQVGHLCNENNGSRRTGPCVLPLLDEISYGNDGQSRLQLCSGKRKSAFYGAGGDGDEHDQISRKKRLATNKGLADDLKLFGGVELNSREYQGRRDLELELGQTKIDLNQQLDGEYLCL